MKIRSMISYGPLRAGQLYDVQQADENIVVLKGVPGVWAVSDFVIESQQPEVYLAVAYEFPVVGFPLNCKKIDGCRLTGEVRILEIITTSPVVEMNYVGGNVWNVRTYSGNLYIVQVVV